MPIRLKNGSTIKVEKGKTILEYLDKNHDYLCAKVNGNLVDLSYIIDDPDAEIEILDFTSEEGKSVFWHTSAHVLAQAVKELFPDFKLTIGPPIENGFYYDFYTHGYTFTPEDLEKIEEKCKEIIKRDLKPLRINLPKDEAIKLLEELDEPFKLELIREFPEEFVSFYKQGDFIDLCRGPHIPRTSLIKAFKVLSSSSSYWRGDESRESLQRIYGISFPTQQELEEYLYRLEEAKKRDHRLLGKNLELFFYSEDVGPGLVLWQPRGASLRRIIENYMFELQLKEGYLPVVTPHIGREKLWKISGHLEFYGENMFPPMVLEDEIYYVKPMNCPFHIQIYKSKHRSYRDLPLRLMEMGTVYRYERSGVLHGLTRVRGFTQDDAHIFLSEDQVEDEVLNIINLTKTVLIKFGFNEYKTNISTKPDKYVGDERLWEIATKALINAVEKASMPYNIQEKEGAFYGPKIDILVHDALGREWQCTTIQLDFNLPQKFEIIYRDASGKDKIPVMIHRAILGSLERFIGVLLEHHKGYLPFWLSPEQVAILPVSEKHLDYAEEIYNILKNENFRVLVDRRNEKLSYKIREWENLKVPYMIIVGEREKRERMLSLRKSGTGDLGTFKIEIVTEMLKKEAEL